MAHRAARPVAVPNHCRLVGERRVLPMAEYASALSERLPHATFEVLAGVGHVPMIDDPGLVARTILAVIGAAKD